MWVETLVSLEDVGSGLAIIKGSSKDPQGPSSRLTGNVSMEMFFWCFFTMNVSEFLARYIKREGNVPQIKELYRKILRLKLKDLMSTLNECQEHVLWK